MSRLITTSYGVIRRMALLSLLLSVCICTAQGKGGSRQYQITAVAFYNFENLFDTLNHPYKFDDDFTPSGNNHYTSEVYKAKLHNLATVIKALATELTPDGPALIGSAEIENAQVLSDLCAQPELRDRHYRFVHFEGPDSRGIDVALLYNPAYFSVLRSEALPVNISEYGEKGGKTRDVLHVVGVLAGDTTHVFVNHWPSRRGGEAASAPLRAIAAKVGKQVIDSLQSKNPKAKILFMGDLNDDPVSPSITKVLGAKGTKRSLQPGDLFNPWAAYYHKGIGTLGYNDSWNLFDQIILSESWLKADSKGWIYYRSEVFNRDFLKVQFGRYKGYPNRSYDGNRWIGGYSDHFPVLIYLVRPAAHN